MVLHVNPPSPQVHIRVDKLVWGFCGRVDALESRKKVEPRIIMDKRNLCLKKSYFRFNMVIRKTWSSIDESTKLQTSMHAATCPTSPSWQTELVTLHPGRGRRNQTSVADQSLHPNFVNCNFDNSYSGVGREQW